MFEIDFLGSGEASDPDRGNTSILVQNGYNILLDAGFQVPSFYFKRNFDPNFLDAIFISHTHCDHVFGIPPLLLDMVYNISPRTKDLILIGQESFQKEFEALMYTAFEFDIFQKDAKFKIHHVVARNGLSLFDYQMDFATTQHLRNPLAIRLEHKEHTLAYSSDGKLTEESKALYRDCNTLIHEAFNFKDEHWGHEDAIGVCEFVKSNMRKISELFLVHISKFELAQYKDQFNELDSKYDFKISLPMPGIKRRLA